MADPSVGVLLSELELTTLLDLCETYEIDLETGAASRTALETALLAVADISSNEILEDLLDEDELQALGACFGLEETDREALVASLEAALREKEPAPRPKPRTRRWTKLDKSVVAAFVFLVCLAPVFGRVWHEAFGSQISHFQEYERTQAVFYGYYERGNVDPWGNPWHVWMCSIGAVGPGYSDGPNGIDEDRAGDDLELVSPDVMQQFTPPQVAIYGRAPLDYVVFLALLLGTFLLARRVGPSRSWYRELGVAAVLATPLIGATLWILHEFWPHCWRYSEAFDRFLLAPAPLAMGASVVLTCWVGVLAVKRLESRKGPTSCDVGPSRDTPGWA